MSGTAKRHFCTGHFCTESFAMNVTLVSDQEPVSLAVSGQVVQRNISPFSDPVEEAIDGDAYSRQVLLNMSGVEMFDSSGVSWLLRCHNRFQQSGGALVVHSLSPNVSDVIRLFKIDQVLTVAADTAEATRIINEKTA